MNENRSVEVAASDDLLVIEPKRRSGIAQCDVLECVFLRYCSLKLATPNGIAKIPSPRVHAADWSVGSASFGVLISRS